MDCMFSASNKHRRNRLAGWLLAWPLFCAATGLRVRAAADVANSPDQEFVVLASGKFSLAAETFGTLHLRIVPPPSSGTAGFSQAAVKQSVTPAKLGPDPSVPYFTVRFALPIPPENATNLAGPLAGIDAAVFTHNHSPGFEILPNGDALAVYFSTPPGQSESATTTTFVQARLRYGAEEWDVPELFFDFKDCNDQSGLLWKDGNKIWFFGGGRGVTPWLPFKIATSANNGATWTVSLPQLDKPAEDFTAQPITSAFRGPDGAIYLAMDAAKDQSFLWRSTDNGVHWHDMGGRTDGRHSVILPLDDKGTLLSIGGKNTGIDGYSPENLSTNWGATWSASKPSPFPALASNQRPSLIRLANGHLCLVTDSYRRRSEKSPEGWKLGEGCIVAISKDNGGTWHFKRLPVELPHERDHRHGTLGYATVRQAPNGVIHVLATMTHPCLHYEFNEAWVLSDAGDVAPETRGGRIEKYSERYPGGAVQATWSARICPNGRYLLDGVETSYFENGRKEHEVTYVNGRKTGEETFWAADGTRLWSWTHHPDRNQSTWTQYWSNGRKRLESNWITQPQARDLARSFFGLVADGPAYQWNADGRMEQTHRFAGGILVNDSTSPGGGSGRTNAPAPK